MTDPHDDERVTDAAADFAKALTERYDTGEVLYRLAEHLTEVLGLAGTGVSLADAEERLHPVTGINEVTTTLEETEERLQEGPCINAYRNAAVVALESTDELVATWPRWSETARQQGVQAVVGVPLRAGGESLGAVNLYNGPARRWHARDLRAAGLFADMAASYIAQRAELERSQELAQQLQYALDARVIIEQAKGVLATNLGCSVDHAFTVLRDHARRTGTSLRSVAQAVVHHGFRPPLPPARGS